MSAALVLAGLRDRRLLGWGALASIGVLLAYGLVTAIIPNPIFGRSLPADGAAIAIWIASAPLAGLVLATYLPLPLPMPAPIPADGVPPRRDGTAVATIGGFGAFIAIGCPLCNKVALLLLGTSGALSVFAPIQPLIGVASIAALAASLAWRLSLRARGGACPVAS